MLFCDRNTGNNDSFRIFEVFFWESFPRRGLYFSVGNWGRESCFLIGERGLGTTWGALVLIGGGGGGLKIKK